MHRNLSYNSNCLKPLFDGVRLHDKREMKIAVLCKLRTNSRIVVRVVVTVLIIIRILKLRQWNVGHSLLNETCPKKF